MGTLIRETLKWLGSKLLILLAIIGILVAANWVRTEWAEISKLERETSKLDHQIADKQKSVAELRAVMNELGDEARQAAERIKDLDAFAEAAHDVWEKANKHWDSCKKQVSPILPRWFDSADYAKERVASKASQAAWEAYEKAKDAANQAREAHKQSPWAVNQARIDAEQKQLDMLEREKKEMIEKTATTPGLRAYLAVREVFPDALWLLAGVILIPLVIKVVLYFIVAPFADKVVPIKIDLGASKVEAPQVLASGVSLDVVVGGADELLVHADYLQSSAKSAHKKTKWFLNHRLPFTSLASGMCLLTKIRAADGAIENLKISPTRDPLGELALIELSAGTAMVLYPRSLAAVVKRREEEIHIQSRWRLKSLHSWLTLQFRYLVFHGPCKVVVKGCRGVCVEKPVSGKPRLISQSATIGFSGNLEYSNTRSEVFISYLLGKDDLFNDLFGGDEGVFVYEEMPDIQRKTGLTGRGLEGITDAFLKAFGI